MSSLFYLETFPSTMIPHYRIEEFRTHPVEIEIQNLGMLKIIFSTYKTNIKKVTRIS